MRSSKLFHFLRQLSDPQGRAFLRYLDSPYHNKKPVLRDMAALFFEKILPYKHRNVTEEAAFEGLFPGKPYNKVFFRKLKTELLEHFHSFLELEAFKQNGPQKHLLRLRQLNALGEERYFEQSLRAAFDAIEHLRDTIAGLEWRSLILTEQYAYEVRQPDRLPPDTLSEARNLLHDYHAAAEIRFAFLAMNRAVVTGSGENGEVYPAAMERMRSRLQNMPAEAKGYYWLLECAFGNEVDAHYGELKGLLDFGEEEVPEWSKDLVTGTLNHAFKVYNAGRADYLVEILEWYKRALVEGILVEKGQLLASHLKNSISVAAKLGEYEWAKELLDRFAERLTGDHHENARTYNEGVIALHQGDFRGAIASFDKVLGDYQDHFYGLDARIFMLQACFLSGEMGLAESLCHSTRMFVRRHQHLSEARKQRYLDFVRYFTRLLECPPHDKARLERLRKDVAEQAKMPAKKWLLEQIAHRLAQG